MTTGSLFSNLVPRENVTNPVMVTHLREHIMTKFYATILSFVATPKRDEDGATAVEYGLLVALIAAVIIAAVVLLGDNINDAFGQINSRL